MGCGIVADQYHGQPGGSQALLGSCFHPCGDLLSYFGGNLFSVDQFGGHVSSCRLGIGKLEVGHCLMLPGELQLNGRLTGLEGTFGTALCH
jgi:hypothetical protein